VPLANALKGNHTLLEDARLQRQAHVEIWDSSLRRVNQYTCDGIMALCGAPIAHEATRKYVCPSARLLIG